MTPKPPVGTVVERVTRETRIRMVLGAPALRVALPVPLFAHFLTACFTTWGLAADVDGSGDVDVDPHHLVEDVGLVMGRALRERWPGYRDVARYGWAVVVMDDARVDVALDLSGRTGCWLSGTPEGAVNGLDAEALAEFWQGLARGGQLTVHVAVQAGHNRHHQWEASFKALGLALSMATTTRAGTLSTKGVIGDGGGDSGPGAR